MIWLLAIAAAIYFMIGDPFDAWIMLIAIIPIAAIDVVIEYRTENALEKLRKITTPRTTVIRNGSELLIYSTELVPGDLFLINEGDVIPADSILAEAAELKLDESALSGESALVEKSVQEKYSEDVFNNPSVVFAGTVVLGGRGKAIAFKTGFSTNYGKIGAMLSSIKTAKTPLQNNIDSIVKNIGIIS
ncbi:hypothetical protein KJ780_00230, partial [Candidatus Micrarchaeota archaeon]|nr:hypothetical protein [Candidatus Micrarchaeota archaeon]